MTGQKERRKSVRQPDDTLSPELVALLLKCGGEVRESDRASIEGDPNNNRQWDRRRPERRRNATGL